MTQGRIENSIRQLAILPAAEGFSIPDSLQDLSASPSLVITPVNSQPALKFLDGLGLIDSFGNVYEGYVDAGGAWEGVSEVGGTPTPDALKTTDLDDVFANQAQTYEVLVFQGTGQYGPQLIKVDSMDTNSVGTAQLIANAVDENKIANNAVRTVHVQDSNITYGKIQDVGANKMLGSIAGGTVEEITVTAAGRALLDDADATAQIATLGLDTITDFIAVHIEYPTDKTYRLINNLPFAITVLAGSFEIATGPASVSFPTPGGVSAGQPIDITVTGTDVTSEGLVLTIPYTRSLP